MVATMRLARARRRSVAAGSGAAPAASRLGVVEPAELEPVAAREVVVVGELLAEDRVADAVGERLGEAHTGVGGGDQAAEAAHARLQARGRGLDVLDLRDELLPLLGLEAAEDGVQQAGLADEQAPDGRRADVGLVRDALDGDGLVAVRRRARGGRPRRRGWPSARGRRSTRRADPRGSAPARGRPRRRGVLVRRRSRGAVPEFMFLTDVLRPIRSGLYCPAARRRGAPRRPTQGEKMRSTHVPPATDGSRSSRWPRLLACGLAGGVVSAFGSDASSPAASPGRQDRAARRLDRRARQPQPVHRVRDVQRSSSSTSTTTTWSASRRATCSRTPELATSWDALARRQGLDLQAARGRQVAGRRAVHRRRRRLHLSTTSSTTR